MTRLERRVFRRSLTIGALLTLMVVGADAFGLLDSFEYWLYDQRAMHCQLDAPPPTSQLVHLDIDDASVAPTALGRWPWPRGKLAQILNEVGRAHPSAIGLDILFSEPQPNRLAVDAAGKLTTEDDDNDLAAAMRNCGNTVLAASFKLESGQTQSDGPPQAIGWFTADLEMTRDAFARQLAQAGAVQTSGQAFEDLFLGLRSRAMKMRIDAELDKGPATEDQVLHRLLPSVDSLDDSHPLRQLFSEQYALASAERAVYRFGAPLQTLSPPPALGTLNVVPLARFSNVAAGCAFANYDIFDNATVRSIPLFVQYNNRLYPQMGLATACVMLGANPSAVRFDGSNIIIPAPQKPIIIPTYTYHSAALGRSVPLIAAVPWFGTHDWETMYDWPAHRNTTAHVSMAVIWDICDALQRLTTDANTIDLAIANILDNARPDQLQLDPTLAKKYAASPPAPTDLATRQKMAQTTLKDLKDAGWQEMFRQTPDAELSPEERLQKVLLNDAVNALTLTLSKYQQVDNLIESKRRWLSSTLSGKGVLIGFTATGFQDQVSTSLHLHCPGVVVHGVIVNAVVTNHWWRMIPWWVTVLITVLFGMAAAAIQGRFQPLRAGYLILAMLLAYALFNGFILFDWQKWIVGLAAPSVAMVVVWAGCTLDRLIVEGIERNRIAMENAVISKEMDLARQVQVALYPTNPQKIVGIESEGWALTASVTGGDCYDLWQLPDGRLAVLLADASGHGLAPAMIVSQVRTLARTLCEFENHPHGLLARINRRLADDLEATRFVTAFLGFFSPDGTLHWASAGHGPMYWTPAVNGEMIELDSTGLPLGVMPDCFLEDPRPPLVLGPNGSLIVFSDGIFEAHAPDGSMFGVERVKAILEKTTGQPCVSIIAAIREAVQQFQQKIEPSDDQTVVVVRRVSST